MDINELREKILAVLNQATENARDVAEQATGTVRDFADKAMGSARAGGRIAKLAMEVASEKESIKKTYQEIGRLYYETAKDAPDGFFIQLFEEVRLGEQSIAEKEAELNELKSSFQKPFGVDVEFEFVVGQTEAEAEGGPEQPAEEPAAEEPKAGEPEEAPAEEPKEE